MRLINEIIIHTFATKEDWMLGRPFAEKVAEVKKWHLARRFNDIGYHYLISREGEIIKGREDAIAGAHVKGHNANSIGISLEGGYGHFRTDDFLDVYTVKQGTALVQLLDTLETTYGKLPINPHNKYANKECPAFDLTAWLAQTPVGPTPEPSVKAGSLITLIVAVIAAVIAKLGGLF